MIGFSIEFKRWYFVLRGPLGRVYLTAGFASRPPVVIPSGFTTWKDFFDKEGHNLCSPDEQPEDTLTQ
jgi:hypothetical protein